MRSGIIPAGAGKSRLTHGAAKEGRDHPRGCGEKHADIRKAIADEGSSPRVRGKGSALAAPRWMPGIIPAGAGKSRPTGQRKEAQRDHPRGCGEKRAGVCQRSVHRGSSPRVRGKGGVCRARDPRLGIIPAGAGKRPRSPAGRRWPRDHPRGCGEKKSAGSAMLPVMGSSPRVRGKARKLPLPCLRRGIIPAGAGKSPKSHIHQC